LILAGFGVGYGGVYTPTCFESEEQVVVTSPISPVT